MCAIGHHGTSGRGDAIFVENAPREGALVTEPQLGKQVGISGDLNGRSAADGEPLAEGDGKVSVARSDKKVDSRSDGGKHELAASTRSRRNCLRFAYPGFRYRVETNNSSREWTSGGLLKRDAVHRPSLG